MIVGERKPFEEVKQGLDDYKKVLVLGCGTCVSVCMAGGEKEVELLASQLRMANKLDNRDVEIKEATIQRQCDREYIEPILEMAGECDVVLSMACGAGVQMVADLAEPIPVIPALDTRFIGITDAEGSWSEKCRACGNCILGEYAGICPITRCPKSILNGPCGGSQNGKCEIDSNNDCAWALIIERLSKMGKLKDLEAIHSPKDYSKIVSPKKITI